MISPSPRTHRSRSRRVPRRLSGASLQRLVAGNNNVAGTLAVSLDLELDRSLPIVSSVCAKRVCRGIGLVKGQVL